MSLDLAIANSIPLDEHDWHERADQPECGDFVRFLAETRANGSIADAWQLFVDEAKFVERKLANFAARGLTVFERATSDDIRTAAASHRDVVLLAHWKNEKVLRSDLQSTNALLDELQRLPDLPMSSLHAGEDAKSLQAALNDFVDTPLPDEVALQDQLAGRVQRREHLNQLSHLARGNRLEAWDAMLSAAEVASLFPHSFAGTALMAVCTSDVLAEHFRRFHPAAICMCSRGPVRAGVALAKLDAALTLMRARPLPLWRALDEAGDLIDSIATR